VPDSTVTVTDAEIGVTRTTKAAGNGYFQIFNLPVGTYKVTATHGGFDTTSLAGISIKEASAATLTIALKVGEISTSVEVTADPLLNSTDTTNGYTLDSAQIELTPLATGSFTQLAVLSPGVNAELLSGVGVNAGLGNQPIWANGQRDTSNTFQVNGVDVTNLFNGKSSSGDTSQRYNFNIGGGSTGSASSAGAGTIGGANSTGTSAYGSNGNSLPSPPQEFLQALRVNTSMYDAQQGATSGAQIDVSTLTGTNKLHGQMFGTFANNSLNADPYFFKQDALLSESGVGAFPTFLADPSLHRWTAGATVGGTIKKDKLYYFIGYQRLYASDQSNALSQFQVPTGLSDDRSDTGIIAAATSWQGKPYTGAINSIARQLLTAKLPDGQFLIPSAQNTAAFVPGIPNVTLVNTSRLQGDMANGALDYQATQRDRVSFKYYYQNAPTTAPFNLSQTLGFPARQHNLAQVGALDNTLTIGSKLNWEQRLGYSRMGSYSYYNQTLGPDPLTGSLDYGIGLGEPGVEQGTLPGLLISELGYNSTAASGLKVGPYSYFTNLGYFQNRLNPSSNAIFSLGKHTILVGGGYSYTQLNIENNRENEPIIREKTFAKFLTGSAPTAVGMLTSVYNGRNNADRYYRSNEADSYVQDKWQVFSNLSITAGVRWDYHGGLTEKYGNLFNFDPSTFDVSGDTTNGFTVNNAGFIVAGNSPNATQGATNSTLTGRQWGVSPRVGFAWAPKRDGGKFVIRGGFGLYYDRGELFSYLSQPAGNGSGGPFGVTESAPLSVFNTAAGTSLASPIGTIVQPTGLATSVNGSLQSALNGIVGVATSGAGKGLQRCSGLDSQVNYADCGDALNFGAYDKNNVLPYTINMSFNMQWQPRNDLAVTIGYTGNRGRHAVIPIPFNEPQIATPSNPGMVAGKTPHQSGETQSYGFNVLDLNSPSSTMDAYGDTTYNPIQGEYWNTEDGGNADLRAPYIGFSPNAALFKTVGNSSYDALETHLEKRLSHHTQAGVSYTWSHTLDEQSDIGLFFTGDDPANLRDSYASSDFDRTNVLSANFLVALPDFAKAHSLLSYATNGWNMTGIGVFQSGEPFSLYEFYGAVGSVRFGDYPTLMNPVLPVSSKHAALTGNPGSRRTSNGTFYPAIDPSAIAIKYLAPGEKGVPVNATGPQDTYETDFVPGQRNLFRQAGQRRLDLSFRKDFKVSERFGLQYQFNVFNITNTPSLDIPQNQTQIRQNDACEDGGTSDCSDVANYGQVGTTVGDQQGSIGGRGTAGSNLDRIPYANGSGPSTSVPLVQTKGEGSCTSAAGCANNSAQFGSVTNTIGSSRIITMGLRFTY
jgi:hypothetical protein